MHNHTVLKQRLHFCLEQLSPSFAPLRSGLQELRYLHLSVRNGIVPMPKIGLQFCALLRRYFLTNIRCFSLPFQVQHCAFVHIHMKCN